MSVEDHIDVELLARLAFTEKQSQQSYRPYIGVHKWFARRPGTLMRGLLLAEFADAGMNQSFAESHNFSKKVVADPFLGGGSTLTEANRLGCNTVGFDVNPISCWITREQIEEIDLVAYQEKVSDLRNHLRTRIGHLYETRCSRCGEGKKPVRYFHWVRTQNCGNCGEEFGLYPRYEINKATRTAPAVIICPKCERLNTLLPGRVTGTCTCGAKVRDKGNAAKNICTCSHCGSVQVYPQPASAPSDNRLIAIEYECPCSETKQCQLKQPDREDISRIKEAGSELNELHSDLLPKGTIPRGVETSRLHNYGFHKFRDLFSARQLVGLSLSGSWITANSTGRLQRALLTNLCDLARYQNLLCRYDSVTRKCIDAFGMHHLAVKLAWCEANLIGMPTNGELEATGTGSWSRIGRKYSKAKAYCEQPNELVLNSENEVKRQASDEWIGLKRKGAIPRTAQLTSVDSAQAALKGLKFDAVLTDPPYHGCVQYSELMDLCCEWLATFDANFRAEFTGYKERIATDLSGDGETSSDYAEYALGLSKVFRRFAGSLKPQGLFAFTFHHNDPMAYAALATALLDARLHCTACFPCPTEMQVSLHINGRNSSRVDVVFVCRRKEFSQPPLFPKVSPAMTNFERMLHRIGFEMTDADRHCLRLGLVTCRALVELSDEWTLRGRRQEAFNRAAEYFRKSQRRTKNLLVK